jgi:pyruvate dehydrogenase E1 component
MVEDLSDEELQALPRGGHDYRKLYAAYKLATEHTAAPTVILAKTIKGWTLGPEIEARNATHQIKKMTKAQLLALRDRLYLNEEIPDEDLDADEPPYFRPAEDSDAMEYLQARRKILAGSVPSRRVVPVKITPADPKSFSDLLAGSRGQAVSTTMAFARLLRNLVRDPNVGPLVVPIVADEARTFGLEPIIAESKIYAPEGQRYTPVDAGLPLSYAESRSGQLLEEGITEAGATAAFTALATSYATWAKPMLPVYLFYSMFGFQRIGDLTWSLGDARGRGILAGCTAGRTTLLGEGLQHADGHSPLLASVNPACMIYDPAFAYELAIILEDAVGRILGQNSEDRFWYITLYNENYPMPAIPEGDDLLRVKEGILAGAYRFSEAPASSSSSSSSSAASPSSTAASESAGSDATTLESAAASSAAVSSGVASSSVASSSVASASGASGTRRRNRGGRKATLLFSGTSWKAVTEARDMLASEWNVEADTWSITSYAELRRDAISAERWNRLHPGEKQKVPFVTAALGDRGGPVVAVTDFMRAVPDQISRFVERRFVSLGTDGFGRSDTREALRRYFEVDAAHIVVAVLSALAEDGEAKTDEVIDAIKRYDVEPNNPDPWLL